ncbi:MAG: LysR family transcriptional regulator [Planctomycetota bacterium]|nr:LysR family transcriptional regulator [Planctomycetota bacterium]
MDFNQLRYFIEVARVKNFTRAAKNCHIAQPALSMQVRKLEVELGIKLLKRLPRGAELTQEGEVFLPYAERVLNTLNDAQNVAADLNGASRGVVRIVTLPSACVYVLPPKIAAFKRDHPRVDIVLEESVSANIPNVVLSGAFDLGVTQALEPIGRMRRALMQREELLLAVSEKHPLAAKQEVRLKEAAGETFVVTKKDTEFRHLAEDLCRRAGFEMGKPFEADHFDSIQAYCAVGMGVGLIPRTVVLKTLEPAPKYLHITHPKATRSLWVVWPEGGLKNKVAEAMISYLTE